MPIPFKRSDPSRATGRKCVAKSASKAVTPSATSPTVAPELIPLLDLLADLIAQKVWREREVSPECVDREVSEADAVASVQGASTVVIEQLGKSGPFPTFPTDSYPECHHNPNTHPHADEPVRTKENNS